VVESGRYAAKEKMIEENNEWLVGDEKFCQVATIVGSEDCIRNDVFLDVSEMRCRFIIYGLT
jgi:hypothetical protein